MFKAFIFSSHCTMNQFWRKNLRTIMEEKMYLNYAACLSSLQHCVLGKSNSLGRVKKSPSWVWLLFMSFSARVAPKEQGKKVISWCVCHHLCAQTLISYPETITGDGSTEIVTVAQLEVTRVGARLEPILTTSASLCAWQNA